MADGGLCEKSSHLVAHDKLWTVGWIALKFGRVVSKYFW